MHPEAYHELARNEDSGWYYQARISAIHNLIRSFIKPHKQSFKILDIGCGTGGSTIQWQRYGHVTGVEPSPLARELLQKKFPTLQVVEGSFANLTTVLPQQKFDLITILGVIYHSSIKDPQAALQTCANMLRSGGHIIVNEAAFPKLERQHDAFVMGARRFHPDELKRMLTASGFDIVHGGPLLGWAYPIARLSAWRFSKNKGRGASTKPAHHSEDDKPLPRWISAMLYWLTLGEWYWTRYVAPLPFGVSYLVIARKR